LEEVKTQNEDSIEDLTNQLLFLEAKIKSEEEMIDELNGKMIDQKYQEYEEEKMVCEICEERERRIEDELDNQNKHGLIISNPLPLTTSSSSSLSTSISVQSGNSNRQSQSSNHSFEEFIKLKRENHTLKLQVIYMLDRKYNMIKEGVISFE